MVDRDVLNELDESKKGGGSKKKKKSSGGGGSSKGSSSEGTGAYKLSEDEKVKPDDVDITDVRDKIANPELNYDRKASTLREYKKLQIEEVKELHQDMYKTAKSYGDAVDEFVLVLQAMLMTYAQNRTGIAMHVMGEFGKSKSESIDIANEICRKAGEGRTFEKIVALLTERFMD